MKTIKNCCLFIFIILFVTSIYKDLYLNTPSIHHYDAINETALNTNIIKVKVKQGETVLSIVENINQMDEEHINIQQVMADFKDANPNADPYHLKTDTYYYFPIYTNN